MRLFNFPLLAVAILLTSRCLAGPYSLFDGSFNGWEGDTKDTWRIEEAVFTAGGLDKMQPRNEFLSTVKEFGDFELNVKWKLEGTEGFVNGGVQFRTKRIPNNHEVSGYQADLGAGYDGALYDESRRNKILAQPSKEVLEKARKPLGEWNEYRIRAEGPRIQLWLNGVQTVDFTETEKDIPRSGVIAVQIHGGAKSRVWYKDIVITELERGGGLKPPSSPGKDGGSKPPPQIGPVQQRFADPQPTPPREPFKDGKFEIRSGEVIVFTGGTNMVRLIEQGWFEASLALAAKEQTPRFRNMAWEGDTVYEQWRDQNFGSWKEQFDAVNATCVFTWFGQMEALDETHDDAAFEQACAKLLDEFKAVTPRLVVMLPMEFDNHPWPDPIKGLPDNTPKNERVLRLAAIMKKLAVERGAIVLDWPALEKAQERDDPTERTINGVHLSEKEISYLRYYMLTTALGFPHQGFAADSLLPAAVKDKNRLWHDCWKTTNWAFAYSDRTEQPFGKGIGSHPPLAKELEQYKTPIREADERIHALALGKSSPTPEPKPENPKQIPQPPDEERATFKVREGFEVSLFASEADGLVKPLSMRWDERGRLWAACSPNYPQLTPGEPRSDYILVCEDTDGDGRADKFNKWAEGLTMPMGIEFGDGGVYVCESTQLVHFSGDGTGKAGKRTVILSGFGTGDSHQMINSLRWGPDGCLWFSQGLHIFSRIETPWGIVRFDRAGLWRFNPRTWKLQGFFGNAAAGANCWGVTFDDWGQVFHCAADNNPGFYTTPGLGTWPNPPSYYNIGSLAVSPVKGMCMEFINSTHLPPELQGVLCKPVYFANQLLLYKLVEDGSGYKTEDLGPLLTSSSNAFRPLGVQTGPDGALYVCDWYNPVIGHYQASYRDPNRDKIHGRIWRVSAKGRPLSKRPELEKMSPAQLIEQLRSPERWARDQAKRLLFFKADGGISEELWLEVDAPPAFLYEALSVQAGQGNINERLLYKCLGSEDARLRAFAVRVWSQRSFADEATLSPDDEEDIEKRLANMVNDPHPRVRLEAAIAASYMKSATAAELACGVLDHPHDRFIDYALANTVRALKPYWSPALESGRLTFEGNAMHMAFVFQADGAQNMQAVLRKAMENAKLDPTSLNVLRCLLIQTGEPPDLSAAVNAGPLSAEILNALARAARERGRKPDNDGTDQQLATLLSSGEPDVRASAAGLAGAWRRSDLADAVEKFAVAGDARAVAPLAELKGREAIPVLTSLTADTNSMPVRAAALEALARIDSSLAAATATQMMAKPSGDITAMVIPPFLKSASGPELLAKALAKMPPAKETALSALNVLATAGRSDAELVEVLQKAAGLPGASVLAYSPKLVTRLIAEAKTSGDASRGNEVFHMAQSACTGCHKVGDTGGVTGPDLTAAGRGMTPELITESVFWPKRQIKEGFFLTTITTKDGKILSGYKQSEDGTILTLRTPGVPVTESIGKEQIKDRSDTGSLMPDGLTGWMTEQQRRDLLRYLFELGK